MALAVALVAVLAAAAPVVTPPASADAGCNKYADPNGNDANSGNSPALAKQSPIALLNALAPGQVGCLADGATFTFGRFAAVTGAAGSPGQPKTLRPTTPGARATISTQSGFLFNVDSHDLVIEDIDFRRHSSQDNGSLLLVDGDRVTLDGLDLTYPDNICLDVGGDPRGGATDPAEDFVLRNSRIHDCGSAYGPPHSVDDSGVHGIYAQFLRDGADAGATNDNYSAIFEDNLIYANHNRGIQLYPDTDDAIIRRNVIYGNGANVNIGSASAAVASERNTFTDNIISESTLDGLTPGGFIGDTNEVLGNLIGVNNPDNHVDGNCINNTAHPTALYAGPGFTHVNNIENQNPGFANAAAGDFALAANSPCLGKGPTSIQPAVVPPTDSTPVFARKWGTLGTGAGQFSSPESVDTSADGSQVYVADADNHRIEQFDARGRFVRQWGSSGTTAGRFSRPVDLAVADNGDVYVADLNNNRIQQFTANGVFIRQWTHSAGGGGAFNPHGIAVAANGVFVADLLNDRVLRFGLDGSFVQTIGSSGSGAGQLDGPGGVAVDPADDRLYVADLLNHRIQYFNFTGGAEGSWGTQGAGTGQFGLPVDVAVDDRDGSVYVVDYLNHRVQWFERPEGGVPPVQFRSWGTQGSGDGQFSNPESIAVVGHQHYVADGGNDRIQVFTAAGFPNCITGSVTEQGTGAPIGHAHLAALRTSDFAVVAGDVADAAGDYQIGLPAGTGSFFLYVIDPTGDHPAGFHGPPATVTVPDGSCVDADPTLVPTRGAVAGTITSEGSGNRIAGAWAITLNGTTAQPGTGAVADGAADFRIDRLTPGNKMMVYVDPTGAHRPEFYNNSPGPDGAGRVAISAGATVSAGAALTPSTPPSGGAALTGTVTRAGSLFPLSGIWVFALHASTYQFAAAATTDGNGEYRLDLNAGNYKLEFVDPSANYHMEWHADQPYYGIANAASVTAPSTVDADLTGATGMMNGRVTEESGGNGVPGAWVIAIGPTGLAAAEADGGGYYFIDGLPLGTYRATVLAPGSGRDQEYWEDSPNYAGATPFAITAIQGTFGAQINPIMDCPPQGCF